MPSFSAQATQGSNSRPSTPTNTPQSEYPRGPKQYPSYPAGAAGQEYEFLGIGSQFAHDTPTPIRSRKQCERRRRRAPKA